MACPLYRTLLNRLVNRSTASSKVRCLFRSYSSGDDKSGDAPRAPYAGAYKDPVKILMNDFKRMGKRVSESDLLPIPRESDIVIIGGGVMGLSAAYWLKEKNPRALTVTVVEQDPTYTRAATVLSVGGIRQQFSLPENIQMSMFTAEFLRDIKEHLSVLDLEPPDIQFNHQGYLFLASDKGTDILRENHEVQIKEGAKVQLLDKDGLKAKFPWMNVDDIELGSYGLENEGWFDPWLLLAALKAKCANLGVRFVKGEAVGFDKDLTKGVVASDHGPLRRETLERVLVKNPEDGVLHPITFAAIINAAGPWAGQVARLADIGTGAGPLGVPLPVEPRKRYVFLVHCPDGPGLDMPMIVDSSGVYVRREGLGGNYICGVSPANQAEEPGVGDLDVDYDWFMERIWPVLAHRLPAFEKLKVKSAWAGYYDYNYFDENLIIGNHPYHRNFYFMTGASGHGLQQSVAAGRAITEYILDHGYQTIDLSRFSFDRVMENEPVFEKCCV